MSIPDIELLYTPLHKSGDFRLFPDSPKDEALKYLIDYIAPRQWHKAMERFNAFKTGLRPWKLKALTHNFNVPGFVPTRRPAWTSNRVDVYTGLLVELVYNPTQYQQMKVLCSSYLCTLDSPSIFVTLAAMFVNSDMLDPVTCCSQRKTSQMERLSWSYLQQSMGAPHVALRVPVIHCR